jgi:hypothetical protein
MELAGDEGGGGDRFRCLLARTKGAKWRSALRLPCAKTEGEMEGVGARARCAKEIGGGRSTLGGTEEGGRHSATARHSGGGRWSGE